MLPTEEARLRRWPRHVGAPSGCAPTHAICWRPRNPHRPHPTKQRPSSPRFPPCEAFEPRPPAARPTVVQGAGVRNPSAKPTCAMKRWTSASARNRGRSSFDSETLRLFGPTAIVLATPITCDAGPGAASQSADTGLAAARDKRRFLSLFRGVNSQLLAEILPVFADKDPCSENRKQGFSAFARGA